MFLGAFRFELGTPWVREYLGAPNGKWVEFPETLQYPGVSFRCPAELLKTFGLALGEHGILHQDLVFNSKELAATRFHLEDMRALVFKKDPACR